MFTLCPECKHSQQISRKRLKKKRGQLTCSKCKLQFDARGTLSKKPHHQEPKAPVPVALIPEFSTLIKPQNQAIEKTETPIIGAPETTDEPVNESETYAWQKTRPPYRPKQWLYGSIVGLALLLSQVYYFKGYSLSQNPQIRPWLSSLSSTINSPLADYRKPQEFTTIGSSLKFLNEDHFRLQVSLVNHANFRQPPPYLQLTLQNFYGGVFAQRTFSPQEYLGKTDTIAPIESSASLDIDFLIATPEQDIGGYTIELK